MKHPDIPQALTIPWLREAYLKRELAPADVMKEVILRSVADAEWNIWITPPQMVLIQPYLERLTLMDPAEAPLWGIPFAIKDNIDLAGVHTTAGCPDYAYEPVEHAAVVARLIAAGAIPVGKTNLDQFATGLVGMRSPYGETHNGLRSELISGGSSSGSAVAVARGHAAFALGTDTAGSGRVPAALNGLVGFKPSLGAWPTKGVVPACASLDCVTVFAHEWADAMAVDRTVRGIDSSDPWSKSAAAPVPALPKKLCLPAEPLSFFGPYAEAYAAAWQSTIQALLKLNIPVEYIDTDLFAQASSLLYGGPYVEERRAGLGDFIVGHPGSTLAVTEQVLRSGEASGYDGAAVFRAMHKLQELKLEVKIRLADAVLVLPTSGGTWTREQVRLNPLDTNSAMGLYTNHCNLLDLCAAAVPAGEAAAGVPFGVTLFALAENESLVCGSAAAWIGGGRGSAELADGSEAEVSASAAQESFKAPAEHEDAVLIAVCGLHMRGFPLERQMLASGARFVRADWTAEKYRMFKLPTAPAKPGLVKQRQGGASIELEVWEMRASSFGAFVAAIPAPLGIGRIELLDGTELPGFVCEAYAVEAVEALDITGSGGWRYAVEARG